MPIALARRIGAEQLAKMAAGINPIQERQTQKTASLTLEKVFEDYIANAKSRLSVNTISNYETVLNNHLKEWKERQFRTISRSDILAKHHSLSDFSATSANKSMRVLRALFNFSNGFYDLEQISNPVDIIKHTRNWNNEARRTTTIKNHQLRSWRLATDQRRSQSIYCDSIADYLQLILFTGMRRQEAACLRRSSVDLQDKSFRVDDTKNGQSLTLPMSDKVEEILRRRIATSDTEFLFPGDGKNGYINDPRKEIALIRSSCGFHFTIHDLRRTFITLAESLDISAYALKALINHKVGSDVTAGYIIMNVERLRKPMQQITDAIIELSS